MKICMPICSANAWKKSAYLSRSAACCLYVIISAAIMAMNLTQDSIK
ncbi:Uncharacterised protein [Mycobacteroides abscessus subsp. abscessus]|nr:Uncharacterised protein [Mycobacteroides abscessus subsp. abscessus]